MSLGSALSVTHSLVTTTSSTFGSEGSLYITEVMKLSMMVRRPRAPVLSLMAVLAISLTAAGSTVSFTPSSAISF